MIELAEARLRNFGSYGDYDTVLDFTKLKQCLILGSVEDEHGQVNKKRSNGAGKSTLINGVLWCMFNRTMHRPNPGDRVINRLTGKDCLSQLRLVNNDRLTRTRKMEGHNEFLWESNDRDRSLSTPSQQQLEFQKAFNLDWNIFCGAMFMSQYNKPWLEMQDTARKRAFEKILKTDRLDFYADVANEKEEKAKTESGSSKRVVIDLETVLAEVQIEREHTIAADANFEATRKERILRIIAQYKEVQATQTALEVPDVAALKQQWETVKAVEAKIRELELTALEISHSLRTKNDDIARCNREIQKWRAYAGTRCDRCRQPVQAGHIAEQTAPFAQELEAATAAADDFSQQHAAIKVRVDSAKQILATKKPMMTVERAMQISNESQRLSDRLKQLLADADSIKKESNPHTASIQRLDDRVADMHAKIDGTKAKMTQFDIIAAHENYIYRAYHDRRKIKGSVIADRIPYFNNRLSYYLDRVGLDLPVKMTESLSLDFQDIDYDFFSGGERKRADLAFMLSTFDLHELIWGKQCNVLVLDDIDGWMDEDGIETMKDVIMGELAPRIPSILVVSHTTAMQGAFPNEIRVRRNKDRQSYIEEVR